MREHLVGSLWVCPMFSFKELISVAFVKACGLKAELKSILEVGGVGL